MEKKKKYESVCNDALSSQRLWLDSSLGIVGKLLCLFPFFAEC